MSKYGGSAAALLTGLIKINEQHRSKERRQSHYTRTSDGGNGNHSVSLPIILIKIKVGQMLPSSHISSILVSIL